MIAKEVRTEVNLKLALLVGIFNRIHVTSEIRGAV